ncbi:MAG: hypothetical protein M0R46_03795 [Candidatus Muirbacterium halophilum]|nr:hypothetical protein [Candidatus Muirbacterium halophilum]
MKKTFIIFSVIFFLFNISCNNKAKMTKIKPLSAGNEKITLYNTRHGLIDDFITSLVVEKLKDREIIWIGTWKGIVKYDDDDRWVSYTSGDGLSQDHVTDITIDNSNNLWASTISLKNEGGVSKFDGRKWENFNKFGKNAEYANVVSMFTDSKDRVWVGTWGKGIGYYFNDKWSFFDTSDGLPSDEIMDITEFNGNIWFATKNDGAFYLLEDSMTWEKVNEHSSKIINDSICSIKAGKNEIWIGTWGGVSVFNGKSWKSYTHWTGLLDNFIRTIDYDESTGYTYFGTDKGLSIFKDDEWINYDSTGVFKMEAGKKVYSSQTEKLPSDKITCIAVSESFIWVGTDKGLARIQK